MVFLYHVQNLHIHAEKTHNNTGAHADQAAMAAPEPCGVEGLGTDLGTTRGDAKGHILRVRIALNMISSVASFASCFPR